jgi:tetrathionate reductase subunit B
MPRPKRARPASAASPAVRWGLLIDANKCAPGCTKCIDACHSENGVSEKLPDPRQNSQWIRKIELVDRRNGRKTELPMMCQHCANPPCVDVCPTGASMKRADGIVLVDRHTCIGCRYCMMACPYKARSFVHAPLTSRIPKCRAARAASNPARSACIAWTRASNRPASNPAPRAP